MTYSLKSLLDKKKYVLYEISLFHDHLLFKGVK
jgi:hypothetical protein